MDIYKKTIYFLTSLAEVCEWPDLQEILSNAGSFCYRPLNSYVGSGGVINPSFLALDTAAARLLTPRRRYAFESRFRTVEFATHIFSANSEAVASGWAAQ